MHLVWFRKDLRVIDNPALYHACDENSNGTIAIYLITPDMWRKHDDAACKINFYLAGLRELKKQLAQLNIPLLIRQSSGDGAEIISEVCQTYKIQTCYFNREYEFDERLRDIALIDQLQRDGLRAETFHDQCLLAPGAVKKQDGSAYRVFTPFRKQWLQVVSESILAILPTPSKQKPLAIKSDSIPDKLAEFTALSWESNPWPAGSFAADKKLQQFIAEQASAYQLQRDFPAIEGTSQLSAYLTAGIISVRQCFLAALAANNSDLWGGNQGLITWMTELIWREFYRHILVAFPHVCQNQPFQENMRTIPWRNNQAHLTAWQQGKTGIPIVDAAMRQLNATGWMHNRCRMIVAMFFSKNLLLDWRLGERYFMQQLIDGDFASNNGGWQWSASTGTDAAPYFRIFNPITQGIKFDPQGDYIRRYCPELAALDTKVLHQPKAPIVDVKISRAEAIAVFKSTLKK